MDFVAEKIIRFLNIVRAREHLFIGCFVFVAFPRFFVNARVCHADESLPSLVTMTLPRSGAAKYSWFFR